VIFINMKYIITENQYEKLLKASLKRHANDPERNIKGGNFIYNGKPVKYSIFSREGKSIYVNYGYDKTHHTTYIMSDENFIQMDKKEQEKVVEFRIKKNIDKKTNQI